MSDECKYNRCGRPIRRIGFCATHYTRQRLGQDMSAPIRGWRGDPESQFWEKVQKTDQCWQWKAFLDKKGYGRHGSKLAHRVAYELQNGPIPNGALLDHTCHNRSCVNPGHLRPANDAANSQNRSGAARTSRSGVRGVYWSARDNGWRAVGWRPYLGCFPTIEEAENVITEWRRVNMPNSLMDHDRAHVLPISPVIDHYLEMSIN
jgi:HNH endonuclease